MRAVSLFSGLGGLDIGVHRAGFRVVAASDIEPLCRTSYTHEGSFGPASRFIVDNVSEITADTLLSGLERGSPKIDLMVGGPPCPPYSKSRFYLKEKPRGIKDPVGDETLNGYIRLLTEMEPRSFLFENVAGFAYRSHPEAFQELRKAAEHLGYNLSHAVLNAADFGVPQIRQRFFMVGLKGKTFRFPEPTHFDQNKVDRGIFSTTSTAWTTAGEAIGDLDTEENASDEGHRAGGKHHDLLRLVPPGDNYLYFTEKRGHPDPQFKWRSRYWSFLLKLSPERPSWTIQARRSNNMGPFHWRNRILRISEIKRLQTIPDEWYIEGTVEQQWRQVGNAVPPLLAEVLAKEIARQLER